MRGLKDHEKINGGQVDLSGINTSFTRYWITRKNILISKNISNTHPTPRAPSLRPRVRGDLTPCQGRRGAGGASTASCCQRDKQVYHSPVLPPSQCSRASPPVMGVVGPWVPAPACRQERRGRCSRGGEHGHPEARC